MRLKVRHVIQLAAGLNGRDPDDLYGPTEDVGASMLRGIAAYVARVHCDVPLDDMARVFGVSTAFLVMDIRRGDLIARDLPNKANELHFAVVRLKAAWRREAAMNRWRALQDPVPVVHGPWRPAEIKKGPRPESKAAKSSWVETEAPVGAEQHAA